MSALMSFLDTQNDVPLSTVQRDALTTLLTMEKQKRLIDPLAKHPQYEDVTPMFGQEPDMPSVLRVLYERAVWASVNERITKSLALWIGFLAEDEHYISVLWAFTLKRWGDAQLHDTLTLAEWTTKWPMLPSTVEMRRAWTEQKRPNAPNGNSLDMPQNWL